MPILFAIFIIAAYVFFSRRREARKRAAWKEETDKRMSMVSSDWQSISAAGATAIRGSFHTPRGSVHLRSRSQSMLALDAANGVAAPSPLRKTFASEDVSQLGPRARALSAAAAGGRPLASLVNEKPLPVPGAAGAVPRTRSKSTAALDAAASWFGTRRHGRTTSASATMAPMMATTTPVRPPMPGVNTGRSADDVRPRTLSAASNNPFAGAMAKRDSQAYPPSAARGMAFPTIATTSKPVKDSPLPRTRVDSEARPLENASRARVGSHVSFADDRRRTQSNLSRYRMMDSASFDGYGLEMQDALPALARESLHFFSPLICFRILTSNLQFLLPLVMRTNSNELAQGGAAFPSSDGGHILGPRAQFMSSEYSPGSGSRGSVGSYFGSAPFAEHGESPDDALRRIAAQRRDSVRDSVRDSTRGSEDRSEGSSRSGIFGSLKRGLTRLRN